MDNKDYVDEKEFSRLFEKMISSMTDPPSFDRKEFIGILVELSELFGISKGVTEFYTDVNKEKLKDGEIFCDFDNGRGGPPVICKRFVSKSQAVIKGTIYRPEDEPPLSDNDMRRLDLVVRSLLSFVSRNRLMNALERFGFYDDKGYPNLRAFLRRAGTLYGEGKFNGVYTTALFNLRRFTLINQDIGRDNADVVMKKYYEMISHAVGDDGIVARMGGDNFIMLFKNVHTDRILGILRGIPVNYGSGEDSRVMVSASVGVYPIPDEFVFNTQGDIMDKLIGSSQAAKRDHAKSIIYYDYSMVKENYKAMRVQQLFPKAITEREFRVYYQPKVDVETGRIVGAEALCRWFHDGFMIPPGEFIPILEQTADVCRLDFYMLDAVCADIRRWLDSGKQPVKVSVNLSRKHLADVDLQKHILENIDRHNVPHEYIEIELTETTTDVEFRDLKRIVSGLQEKGISTSVDDFGVGYSSLNLIREIPWNVLKIDRCFLPADGDGERSVTSLMYRHVVSMALELGLECITEGVETAKQIEILRSNGCRIAQGFVFDRPLPIEQFEALLGGHRYELGKIMG